MAMQNIRVFIGRLCSTHFTWCVFECNENHGFLLKIHPKRAWGYHSVGQAVTRSFLHGRFEVQISCRSNRTQICQWLTTAATFFRKELCCPHPQWRRDTLKSIYCLSYCQILSYCQSSNPFIVILSLNHYSFCETMSQMLLSWTPLTEFVVLTHSCLIKIKVFLVIDNDYWNCFTKKALCWPVLLNIFSYEADIFLNLLFINSEQKISLVFLY